MSPISRIAIWRIKYYRRDTFFLTQRRLKSANQSPDRLSKSKIDPFSFSERIERFSKEHNIKKPKDNAELMKRIKAKVEELKKPSYLSNGSSQGNKPLSLSTVDVKLIDGVGKSEGGLASFNVAFPRSKLLSEEKSSISTEKDINTLPSELTTPRRPGLRDVTSSIALSTPVELPNPSISSTSSSLRSKLKHSIITNSVIPESLSMEQKEKKTSMKTTSPLSLSFVGSRESVQNKGLGKSPEENSRINSAYVSTSLSPSLSSDSSSGPSRSTSQSKPADSASTGPAASASKPVPAASLMKSVSDILPNLYKDKRVQHSGSGKSGQGKKKETPSSSVPSHQSGGLRQNNPRQSVSKSSSSNNSLKKHREMSASKDLSVPLNLTTTEAKQSGRKSPESQRPSSEYPVAKTSGSSRRTNEEIGRKRPSSSPSQPSKERVNYRQSPNPSQSVDVKGAPSGKPCDTEGGGQKKRSIMKIKEVVLPHSGSLSIRELASKLSLRPQEIAEQLVEMNELEEAALSSHLDKERSVRSAALLRSGEDGAVAGDFYDQRIDVDVAELLLLELGVEAKRVVSKTKVLEQSVAQSKLIDQLKSNSSEEQLRQRAPIVTIMGHVDHGKTTLLDSLRAMKDRDDKKEKKTKKKDKKKAAEVNSDAVAGTEAGGITQKLSAFSVELTPDLRSSSSSEGSGSPSPERIVFLDTPGHAAFSAMRSQGILATDIVVLVVALDDGVQPQTVEAIKAAQQANCAMIVAINKIDKFPNFTEREEAKRKVLNSLAEHNLLTEEYGGDVQIVEVAGRTGEGLADLVSSISAQSEIMDLKAKFEGFAEGIVLEAKHERGRGVVAEVLVRWGSLKPGDSIVVGTTAAKIKSILSDKGTAIPEAFPSQVVKILGLTEIPSKGIELLSVESELKAKRIIDRRLRLEAVRSAASAVKSPPVPTSPVAPASPTLSPKLMAAAAKLAAARGEVEELSPIEKIVPVVGIGLQADSTGALDALRKIVESIAEKVKEDLTLRIIHSSIGNLSPSDIDKCASAANDAVMLAFNIGSIDAQTTSTAKELDIQIFRNDVIYGLEDALIEQLESLLPKHQTISKEGSGKVLQTFKLRGAAEAVVAGLSVQSGKLKRSAGSSKKTAGTPSALQALINKNTAAKGKEVSYFYRVLRNGEEILSESKGSISLRRFKDEVNEVDCGLECGLVLEGFTDFKVGDEVECFQVVREPKRIPRLSAETATASSEPA